MVQKMKLSILLIGQTADACDANNFFMKKGFSLLELIVVVALSSILLLAAANFLAFSIQRNNQITVENSVRSEATSLIDTVSRDVRKSSCECYSADSLSLFENAGCETYCASGVGPTPYAVYQVSGSQDFLRNSTVISGSSVRVRSCLDCSCQTFSPGFTVSKPDALVRAYVIAISLTQARNNPRSDFCGKVSVKQTVRPRN